MLIIYALDLDLLALVLSSPDLLLGFIGLYWALLGFIGLNGQPIDGISYFLFPFLAAI